LQTDEKSNRRAKLIDAAIEITAESGHDAATAVRVCARAGVSLAVFGELFADQEQCLLASISHAHECLRAEVVKQVSGREPHTALSAALGALVGFAESRPAMALLVMHEALVAGARPMHARDEGVDELACIVGRAYSGLPSSAMIPDISTHGVIGATQRLLAVQLRRREPVLPGMLADLRAWVRSYDHEARGHRWRTSTPAMRPLRSPFVPPVALQAPPTLGLQQGGVSTRQVRENHRQRILFATAAVIRREGYRGASIAEIVKLAELDGRDFYDQFVDKQDALMAFHEFLFKRAMAVTAGAFFASDGWPERVWEAGRALLQFLEQNPMPTYVTLVDSAAASRVAAQRLEDLISAFTLFLQEGYELTGHAAGPSALALKAITATIFELLYRRAREDAHEPDMASSLGHLAHLCVAPFLGPQRADQLIEEWARAESEALA
jgi:AcrR family transcriptional regulator